MTHLTGPWISHCERWRRSKGAEHFFGVKSGQILHVKQARGGSFAAESVSTCHTAGTAIFQDLGGGGGLAYKDRAWLPPPSHGCGDG